MRNFQPETNFLDSDMQRNTIPDTFDPSNNSTENQDLDAPFRRSAYSKKSSKKTENLDGVMFLADGKVLIVNNDLYQEVMKKAIIIDLKDKGDMRMQSNSSSSEEESKDYPQAQIKSENSRSVTQAKKNKKSVMSMSQAPKRTPTIEEPIMDTGEAKKREYVPLNKEIHKMLNNKEFSDIILIIGGKEIFAHKAILSARSTYFHAMFSHDFRESEKSKIILKGVVSNESIFYDLLEFMYCDSIKINLKNIFDMLSLADEYGVASYKEK